MIQLMLLAGTALCVISVVMAVIAVAQTRAPRAAAIALMLGFIVLFVAARMQPGAVTPENVVQVWQKLMRGELTLEEPAPAEAPAPAPAAQ